MSDSVITMNRIAPKYLPVGPERARELLSRFGRHRILVIGDIMIDRYVFGRVERLNPEAPVPILHARENRRSTGGAGNTAKNATYLGARTTLISVVGADRTADELQATISEERYEAILLRDSRRPTTEKMRFVVGSQQMLRVDYEEAHDITSEIEDAVIQAIECRAPENDAIIVSDYAKGLITSRIAAAIVAAAKKCHIPVMADVKPSHVTSFEGVSYISPNRKEAHEFLGFNHHLKGGLPHDELAARLHALLKATVFLTLSEDGMFVYGDGKKGIHVPQTHRVEIADTSGCGDTAAVAITLAKLAGASDIEAAEIGNAAGAIVAGKLGAVALTRDELLDVLCAR